MPKADMIEMEGIVKEVYPQSKFLVEADIGNGSKTAVMCVPSGKLRTNFIKILAGDKVKIEVSPYDLSKGRITWRYK